MFHTKQTLSSYNGEDTTDKLNISKFHKPKVIGGFTLVELVIVIIILAILATIAFLNFHSYASSSRDSTRLADINSLNKSLELYNIKSGKYPDPTSIYTRVSYSGGVIFEQGTVGNSVFNILSVNINKKPVDPLDSTEYTYSTNILRVEYQLKGNLENKLQVGLDDNIFNVGNVFNSTNAAGTGASICYVKGNYNGLVERTNTGDTNYLLAVPGLIVGEVNPNLDFGSLSGKVICNGLTNPCIIDYNPTTVYVGEDNTWPTTATEIEDIMTNLQNAYSGSNVASSNSLISNILSASGGNLTALGIGMAAKVGITSTNGIEVDNYSCQPTTNNGYNLDYQVHEETKTYTKTGATAYGIRTYTISATCNNSVFEFGVEDIEVACDTGYAPGDGDICVIHSCTSTIADSHARSTATALNGTAWHYAATPEACSRNCITGYKWDGSSCKSIYFPGLDGVSGTADDCKGADIKLGQQVWSACNLGANTPWNGSNHGNFNSYGSSTRGGNDNVNGKLYQWGRNKGFPSNTTALTTGRLPASINSNDVYNWVKSNDWVNAANNGLWGGSTSDNGGADAAGTSDLGRKGPCPTGRHVPSFKDWQLACNASIGGTCYNGIRTAALQNRLLLPYAGDRNWTNGRYTDQATNGDYWSSTPGGGDIGGGVGFNSSSVCVTCGNKRGYAFSVRCIKND